jgi:hypothetical protein
MLLVSWQPLQSSLTGSWSRLPFGAREPSRLPYMTEPFAHLEEPRMCIMSSTVQMMDFNA